MKYILNLNSNHFVDRSFTEDVTVTNVFHGSFVPREYKVENNLKTICRKRINELREEYIDEGNTTAIGFDESIYVIYSGLTVVLISFITELIKEGYRPIVLFEDKENGGYYRVEANY